MNIYDISTDTWSSGATGGTARADFASVLYNGKIYYWGGYNSSYVNINSLDIYDIATNSWSTGTAGGTARWAHIGQGYNNKLYFWGGYDDINFLNTMDIYDIATNSWSTGTAGGTGRYFPYSVEIGGKIYAGGGSSNGNPEGALNTLDIYDITTNSWSTGTAGGTARYEGQAFEYNNRIYIWGGADISGARPNLMDIYDINTDTWSTGTAGGTGRYGFAGGKYDGKFYYWAGWTTARINTLDIYDTGYHPNPEFQNLPGNTVPINLTEGQVVTTPTYTIEVYPTSPNEIEKVEFYVDNVLIDTDYTADGDGVYSTIWDTTQYHSDIRVVAYDPFGRTTELTRTVTVPQDAPTPTPDTTVNELPATGANLISYEVIKVMKLLE